MKAGPAGSFGAQLKALRESAGFTQEELATIAGLSVHAVSALKRGERRRPHVETVRALSAALDLTGATRDALLGSARVPAQDTAVDELSGRSLPLALDGPARPRCRRADAAALARRSRRTPHHAHRSWRSREDPAGAGTRTRDRGRRRDARGVRPVGRHSGSRVRRVGDCRGSRIGGRHRARFAAARSRRVRRSSHVAGARQFRAGTGRGAAGRGSPDVGRRRSGCWSPAAPRSVCAASASTSSDRSRWMRPQTRCRRPIWRALPRCDCSWNACETCNPTFASRPRTARPWRRFAGGSMHCRSRSSWRRRGSKC